MICVFLADGFEEAEALIPTDLLRRASLPVSTVGVTGDVIVGSHGIPVGTDMNIAELKGPVDAVILPGGMPGTLKLEASTPLKAVIEKAAEEGKLICAICAAPSILGHMGLLRGRKATCFPGFEKELEGAEVSVEPCVRDGNFITAKGAGAAFEFAAEIIAALTDGEKAESILKQIQYK